MREEDGDIEEGAKTFGIAASENQTDAQIHNIGQREREEETEREREREGRGTAERTKRETRGGGEDCGPYMYTQPEER